MTIVCALALSTLQDSPFRPLLALTPIMDGVLFEEEWLSMPSNGGAKGYLQWEPGTMYCAGSADMGEDIVVSIDRNGDGWLVGADNIELRFSFSWGEGSVSARTLDAARLEGPGWAQRTADDVTQVFGTQGDRWIVEVVLKKEGWENARVGNRIGVGLEALSHSASGGPAFLPRKLNYYQLAWDASEGLSETSTFRTSTKLREVAKDDSLSMEFEVSGGDMFSTAETRGEGFARSVVSLETRAFPSTDKRKRTRINYRSAVDPDAREGWRVLRSTLVDAKGNKTLLRTSFRVSELIVFDVALPETIEYSEAAQTINGSLAVCSTGVGRVEGEFFTNSPTGWKVEKGVSQKLLIYNPRGREKIGVRLVVPSKAVGANDLTFTVVIGDRVYTKTVTITVTKPG